MKRLEEKGITLNLQKCRFSKHKLEFYGYVFTSEGMKPSENKIKLIKEAARPEDQKAVRSFLGLKRLKRFIQDCSTKTFPLRQLLKHDSKFAWTTECERSFQTLKTELSSNCCLSYFDESKETCIYTDKSPFGISAIPLQKSTDDDYKVISYSLRALTETEQRYSQLERECLPIVYGCEKNRLYLLGRLFDIYNDHKALFHLINNPKGPSI